MKEWWKKNFASCQLGDVRLNKRALSVGQSLSQGFGKALSEIFNSANTLKRTYEFLPTRRQNLPS